MATPVYKISLGGTELKERLLSLIAIDRAGFSADTLTLTLFADNLKLPERGVFISCEIGYEETGTWTLGDFVVEDVKLKGPPPTMVITCISQPQGEQSIAALQTTKQERVWQPFELDGTTFSTVVSQVVSEAGLSPRVDGKLASIKMPYTVQSNESDAAFLHRLTVERNGIVKMNGNEVLFVSRDGGTLGTETIQHDGESMQYSFDVTERYDIGAVRAKWQDDASGEVMQYTAGTGKGVKIIPKVFSDEATARAAAEALLKHYGRNFVSAEITLPTRPGLLAEKIIHTQGFPGGEQTNNEWVVIRATHTLDKRGLLSKLYLKRPQD